LNEKERERESAKRRRRRAFKGKRRTFSLSLLVREKSTERKNAPDPRDLSLQEEAASPGKRNKKKKEITHR